MSKRLHFHAATCWKCLVSSLAIAATLELGLGVEPTNPAARQGAALLKTDIMAVFAHPDDETGMAATLAHYALGKGAAVANVYCTRGEGGGNMVGTHLGPALGILREAELRHCLSRLGVRYCFFLDQADFFYTESVAATFRKWGKEETLRRLVRHVRALRPEVIVTMNPAPTPGQHGHHQAAGVLATEAFDAAADAKMFPDQLTKEGLTLWQVRKLYYGGKEGITIATIPTTEPLANGKTPADVAAEALINHRSQAFGNFANSPWLRRPQSFTLVKSVVPFVSEESDLLRGLPLTNDTVPRPVLPLAAADYENKVVFLGRPAQTRYLGWVRNQRIQHAAASLVPEIPVVPGEQTYVTFGALWRPMSATGPWHDKNLRFEVPQEWAVKSAPHFGQASEPVDAIFIASPRNATADEQITVSGTIKGNPFNAMARIHPVPRLSVTRVRRALPVATSPAESAWAKLPSHAISHTNLWQGKTRDDADSSGTFRIAHDGNSLFVEVVVRDDVVVSNIAPNDIKGHWRSDSVEVCLDPTAGSEDTLGCYKIGIFPFDTTGLIRAARDADANQGPIDETAPKTRLASWRNAGGYGIRVAIPFSEIGISAGRVKKLGFNILIYDGDKRDAALGENINKSRIAWAPRPGVQGRPEDWGRIDLE